MKYKSILMLLPAAWIPIIDKAKEDMERSEWMRAVIRDALIEKGVFKL